MLKFQTVIKFYIISQIAKKNNSQCPPITRIFVKGWLKSNESCRRSSILKFPAPHGTVCKTLALCLTPATVVTNGNFLQTYFIVTYGLAPLQDIRLQNLSDLEFDLSRSLKVICDDVIGLPTYAFLLMFNCNLWPNSAPSQDIRLRNLSDLEFDVLRSNSNDCADVIGLVVHGFLLICTIITCLTLTF